MTNEKLIKKYFSGKTGKKALRELLANGVTDLSRYKCWQLEFYAYALYPWPRCIELFREYDLFRKTHKRIPFEIWFYFFYTGDLPERMVLTDNDDDPAETYIDFIHGEPLDTIEDELGEWHEIDC